MTGYVTWQSALGHKATGAASPTVGGRNSAITAEYLALYSAPPCHGCGDSVGGEGGGERGGADGGRGAEGSSCCPPSVREPPPPPS